MLRSSSSCLAVAGILIALLCPPLGAHVLTLSRQDDASAVVRDASDGGVALNALSSAQGRLLIEAGAATADADHDLVYVAANADPTGPVAGAPANVLASAYGYAPLPSGSLQAPAGFYFVALAFDAPASRLVGIIADSSGAATARLFVVATNAGTALGAPTYVEASAGCCRFISGVAAWRAATQELLTLGRRVGDTEDQLLRFDVGTGVSLPDAYPIAGGDRVVALAVDANDAKVYALARSVLGFSYLARVTWSTPGTAVTLSAIGSAPSACCYVAAGPATIDGSGSARAFYALTRDAGVPAAMQLSRFDLASGNPVVVNAAITGYGLWSDPSVLFDRIFANGFD